MPESHSSTPIQPEALAGALASLREQSPLVQCLTNIVVANFTANLLLAVGASPAMIDNPAEAEAFAGTADGVLVNLGTPYPDTAEGMAAAIRGAESAGTPWVLDPVAVGGLEWRTSLASQFLASYHPAIIRGNASEIMALAGGAGGRGVESLSSADQALEAATKLAGEYETVAAVSGATDHLTDGTRLVRVSNGHPWLQQVIGTGCGLGALMAGFAAVVGDPLCAAAAATATLTVAADVAAGRATGPGSFEVALLDSLDALTPEGLAHAVQLD
jgi:hydroxyethylthiazole kinase